MTFVLDIDGTIIDCDQGKDKYIHSYPLIDEINKLNKLYEDGNTIILHTGRNWANYQATKDQLEIFGVCYNELVMSKPQGIYIDPNSYKSIKDYCNA